MFRNRAIKVTVEKKKPAEGETTEPKTFEEKAEIVVDVLEDLAIKAFFGLCIYIWLDTRRQVRIEEARKYYK